MAKKRTRRKPQTTSSVKLRKLLQALLASKDEQSAPGLDLSQYQALAPESPGSILGQLGSAPPQMESQGGGGGSGGQQAQAAIMAAAQQAAATMGTIAPQIGQYYQQGMGRQMAADQGLAQQMQMGGAQMGGNIALQLAQAGQNVQPGFDVGQLGAGSANTVGAMGNAGLTAMQGEGAAAQSWAASLPGVAMAQGQADSALAAMASQQQAADAATAMRGQQMEYQQNQQQMMLDATNSAKEREYQKAVVRLQYGQDADAAKAAAKADKEDRKFALMKQMMDAQLEEQKTAAGYAHQDASQAAGYAHSDAQQEDRQAEARAAEKRAAKKKAAADAAARKAAKAGAMSSRQADALSDLYSAADDLFTGGAEVPVRNQYGEKTGTKKVKLASDKAYERLMRRLSAQLPGATVARKRRMVERAMAHAGYAPRKAGRSPSARS